MSARNNYDAVRLMAAATVIYGHAYPLTASPNRWILDNPVQGFALKIFFVISGYLVSTSWLADPHILRYLRKRLLRIFPALILTVCLTAFILGPLVTTLSVGSYFASPSLLAYLGNIALKPAYALPGVFTHLPYPSAVNGSLWSLPIEFTMYLVFPIVCLLAGSRMRRMAILALTVVLCLTSLYALHISPNPPRQVFYGTSLASAIGVVPFFLIGSCFKLFDFDRFFDPTLALGLLGCLALIQPAGSIVQEFSAFCVMPYAVLSFASESTPILSRTARWGDLSYGLYLFGFPLQQLTNHIAGRPLSALGNAFLSFPLAIGCAFASWHLVEKRALKFRPQPFEAPVSNVQRESLI